MENKYDVFISYKSETIKVVEAIVNVLEHEKIKCWYAPRDLDNSADGSSYADKILEAIRNSELVVVILCDEALQSQWVTNEITAAQNEGKSIIPYVISKVTVKNGLYLILNSIHWLAAYPDPESKFKVLLDNVRRVLHAKPTDEVGGESPRYFHAEDGMTSESDFDYEEGMVLLEDGDYNDAALTLLSSAERGNAEAKTALCQMFYDLGIEVDQINDEVWIAAKRLADAGHCFANFVMHCKAYNAVDCEQESYTYVRKAVANGKYGLAFLRLGIHYEWGLGVKQSQVLALHNYNKALNLGCKEAYSYLAQVYFYGSEKTEKDEKKALDYCRQGMEKGDKRSFKPYFDYWLFDKNEEKTASETAQKMIDQGWSQGYLLMGTLYQYKEDTKEAKKWFTKAAEHDEKGAYGMLAGILYGEGDTEKAISLAQRGADLRDAFSTFMLGYIYEQQERFDESWRAYKRKYDRNGTGAADLARLVIDKGYWPWGKGESESLTSEQMQVLDELEKMLWVCSKNGDFDSMEYLLRLYHLRKTGSASLDYQAVADIPEARKTIELMVSHGNAEAMYEWGTMMHQVENSEIYNPAKGQMWQMKAAEAGNVKAIKTMLNEMPDSIDAQTEMLPFLLDAIHNKRIGLLDRFLGVKRLFDLEEEESIHLSEEERESVNALMQECFDNRDYGPLKSVWKYALPVLCPGYTFEKGLSDSKSYITNDSVAARIFYAMSDGGKQFETDADAINTFKYNLFLPLTEYVQEHDIRFDTETFARIDDDLRELFNAVANFDTSFRKLCDKHGLPQTDVVTDWVKVPVDRPWIPNSYGEELKSHMLFAMLYLEEKEPAITEYFRDYAQDDRAALDFTETVKDADTQLLLISWIETNIDLEIYFGEHLKWLNMLREGDEQGLQDALRQYLKKMIDAGIDVNALLDSDKIKKHIQWVISEYNREINNVEAEDCEVSAAIESEKALEDDDFDRLLQEFIDDYGTETEEQ